MMTHGRRDIEVAQLERVAHALMGSIVGGASWTEPLERLMPVLGTFGGGLARVTPPDLFGLPSCGVAEVVHAIRARKTPPLTRLTRIDPSPRDGFVCDQMDVYRRARAKDQFCLEYLRPMGVAYQASAYVDETKDGAVNFMLFRGPGSGGFEPSDLVAFAGLLPYIRAAAMASRVALAREAEHAAAPFSNRGDPAIRLSHDGGVLDCPAEALNLLGPEVGVTRSRIRASSAWDQKRIDQALATALARRRPGLVTILGRDQRSSLRLLFVPVVGQALDVFHATAVLLVVLDVSRRPPIDEGALDLLVTAAGLTPRETAVARLVASGHAPRAAAARLGIGYDTIRLHLKAVYAKAGVHSQADLAALLNRYSGH